MIALLINLNFELLSYSDQPGGKSLQHLVYEISHFSQGFLEISKEWFTLRGQFHTQDYYIDAIYTSWYTLIYKVEFRCLSDIPQSLHLAGANVNSQFRIASTIFYSERFRSTWRSGWTIFGWCDVLSLCGCECACVCVCVWIMLKVWDMTQRGLSRTLSVYNMWPVGQNIMHCLSLGWRPRLSGPLH